MQHLRSQGNKMVFWRKRKLDSSILAAIYTLEHQILQRLLQTFIKDFEFLTKLLFCCCQITCTFEMK